MSIKNILWFILLLSILIARPDNSTNVSYYADGQQYYEVVDCDKTTFLDFSSGEAVELEFGPIFYFREIMFYFRPGAIPLKMTLATKLAPHEQFQVVKEINVRGSLVQDLFLVKLPLDDLAAKSLQIRFLADTKIELAEIEFYPNMQVVAQGTLRQPLIITDKEVYLEFEANQELQAVFRLTDQKQILQTPSLGKGKEHSLWLHGLTPATTYQGKVLMQDYLANISETAEIVFQTKSKNLALDKKVVGTFNYYQPDDPYVSQDQPEPIKQINDGDDSYFTSMATSGDPEKQAQYITVDLGIKQPVREAVIVWRALAYSKNYQIEVSDDNLTWQTVLPSLTATDGKFAYSRTGDPVKITYHRLNKEFRYLKIFIPQKSDYYVVDPAWKFVQIMEIKLF